MEQYKIREDTMRCLKQENALQKHRILLLELQAKRVDFVHKTHTNCLQSVSHLKIQNLMLRSRHYRVQSQMENSAIQYKITKKCGNSKQKGVGIQNIFSPSDSVPDLGHTAQSDCYVIQVICFFVYVVLTVNLGIMLDNDQLDTHLLYFTIHLL